MAEGWDHGVPVVSGSRSEAVGETPRLPTGDRGQSSLPWPCSSTPLPACCPTQCNHGHSYLDKPSRAGAAAVESWSPGPNGSWGARQGGWLQPTAPPPLLLLLLARGPVWATRAPARCGSETQQPTGSLDASSHRTRDHTCHTTSWPPTGATSWGLRWPPRRGNSTSPALPGRETTVPRQHLPVPCHLQGSRCPCAACQLAPHSAAWAHHAWLRCQTLACSRVPLPNVPITPSQPQALSPHVLFTPARPQAPSPPPGQQQGSQAGGAVRPRALLGDDSLQPAADVWMPLPASVLRARRRRLS